MNTGSNRPDTKLLERLTAVVATYGADHSRWPAEERKALQSLITRMGSAAGRFREESALDELLDRATSPQPPRGAIDRVLSQARRTGARQGASADVLPFRPRMVSSRPAIAWRPAAGVVAASLILGVLAGNLTMTDDFYFDGIVDAQTEDSETDSDPFAMVDTETVPDEDEP